MVLHFPVSVGNFKSLPPFTPNSCFPLHFSPCQRNLKGFMVILNSVSVILTLSPSCFLASVALNLLSPMTSYWWKTNPLHFVRQRQPFSVFVYFLFPQACGPQYGYMCGQQQYISGVCANVSSSFQILNSVAPAVQGTRILTKRGIPHGTCTHSDSGVEIIPWRQHHPQIVTSDSPSLSEEGD